MNPSKKRLRMSVVLAATLLAGASAHASFTNNTFGLTNPDQTITFEGVSLTRNQVVTDQFANLGVTFSTAFGNPDVSELYPNVTGNRIGNFDSSRTQGGLFTMSFASELTDVAFALVTAPGLSTFQAFLDGALVDSQTWATSTTDAANFFAFRDILFDQITIRVDSSDHALLLDNLQTFVAAPVPEPESWALMLAGSMIVGMVARRRRRVDRP